MNEASILDIISPIMVGPSSSHTAGAVKIGLLARNIAGSDFKKVKITLYNSYAKTGIGHGTDKGIMAGLLGYSVDDTIIKDIFESVDITKIKYRFESKESFTHHPNAVDFVFDDDMELSAQSVGGGEVRVTKINNFSVNLDGKFNCILAVIDDTPGALSKITSIIQKQGINIASISCDRASRGTIANCSIALDGKIEAATMEQIKTQTNPKLLRYVEKLKY